MTDCILFDHTTVTQALTDMTTAIADCNTATTDIYLVGIHSGGAKVADAIQQGLEDRGKTVHRGNLDISFYRDDLDTIGPNPEVRPSTLNFDVSAKNIWLVDDVLYTGRTIRAAMGELFDYGRAASISLAILLDRGGRELPISANCIGLTHPAPGNCTIELITDEQVCDGKKTSNGWHIDQRQIDQRRIDQKQVDQRQIDQRQIDQRKIEQRR
ncbi:MAG: bifunctional pyr operon transcriptional regulator/uracil phosphoribosyltransferase PyrR, partial [Mariprofundus sp.]|nr:bifunctional pyr operon transcriptional regulator/uracil phosphoribosyltransferase PyrR [Mariprofundus sp.]